MIKETSQEEKRLILIGIFLLLGVMTVFFWFFSFSEQIDQTITTTIYTDSNATDTTTVLIQGEKSNYLLQDTDHFNGMFAIQYIDRTWPYPSRPAPLANISWWLNDKPEARQHLLYTQAGTTHTYGIRCIIISEDMTEFALALEDGTIIATSDQQMEELNRRYAI